MKTKTTLKIHLFLFLIFAFSSHLLAQNKEFAPVGAKWYYDYNITPSLGYVEIEYLKDTIISNRNCRVLTKTRYTYDYPGVYNTNYLGNEYIFQSNDSVFNYKYGQFYLLYDFSPNIGDVWVVSAASRDQFASCDTIGKVQVDSIGLFFLNSDTLKIIYTSSYQNSEWIFYGPIVEILGCIGYLLPQQYLCVVGPNEGGMLRCYYDSSFSYQSDSIIPCDFITSMSDKKTVDEQFLNIFPNPANDIINISINSQEGNGFKKVELYNSLGMLIKYYDFTEDSFCKINTHTLSKGIYLMRIITNNDYFERKIIINK